jgi:hypothetical protein
MSTKIHTHTRILTAEGWNRMQASLRGKTSTTASTTKKATLEKAPAEPAPTKSVKVASKTTKGKKT